jgi:ribonuclease HI
MSRIVVATDGSSLGNPGPAGWAWIVHRDCWAAGGLPRATNQAAELFAILAALRAIPLHVPIHIRTDSQYALKACSIWLAGWKANDWQRSNGQPVANITLMKELDRVLTARRVPATWEWVKGHSGNTMNEAADKRCTAAAKAVKDHLVVPTGPGWTGPPARAGSPANNPGNSPAARDARRAETIRVEHRKAMLADTRRSPRVTPQRTTRRTAPAPAPAPVGLPERGLCLSCGAPINPITMECRCSD